MTVLEAGVLDELAEECAAARAEVRRQFAEAKDRARLFVLPARIPAPHAVRRGRRG
jgi:hypothetical protein